MLVEIIFFILISIGILGYCFFALDFDLIVNKIFFSKLSKKGWNIYYFVAVLFLIIFIIIFWLFRENLKDYYGLYN